MLLLRRPSRLTPAPPFTCLSAARLVSYIYPRTGDTHKKYLLLLLLRLLFLYSICITFFFGFFFSPKRYFISCRIASFFLLRRCGNPKRPKGYYYSTTLSHVFFWKWRRCCVCVVERETIVVLFLFFGINQTVDDVPGRCVKQTTIFSAPSNSTQRLHKEGGTDGRKSFGRLCVCVILYIYYSHWPE